MDRELKAGEVTVRLVKGDLAKEAVDVVIGPTDREFSGAGGVDAALRAAGGDAYIAALEAIKAENGPLETSGTVLIQTESLPSKNVILTVGPKWADGYAGEFVALERAYKSALKLAMANEFETLAFASIATGYFGFPDDRAAYVAFNTFVRELSEKSGSIKEVRFVVEDDVKHEVYAAIWDEVVLTMMD